MADQVIFRCNFNGRSVLYTFQTLDKKTSEEIAKILSDNLGKTLLSIGVIEIPFN
jgi:hypothetical protein